MSYANLPSRTRCGVALIIALIILAGLLLLGLPFLFTQSEALAGSRSYAYHQATAVGLTNGEQTAAAAVATGLEHHLVAGQTDSWTREDDDLAAVGMLGDVLTPNLFALDTSATGLTAQRESTAGAWIEDEHGKLNPNDLSPAAWTRLLATAGIIDWDDNEALDSQDFHVDPAGDQYGDGNFDDDGKPGLDGDALKNGDNDDGNNFGELAEALANVRFTLPGRRVTSIDQLLLADPGHNTDAAPAGSDYLNNAAPTGRFGFRRPLTRAELDRVRPFLTLYTPAPGREGLLDLGSMLAVNTDNYMILDDDPWPMARSGSAAIWPEVLNGEDYQYARVNSVAVNPGGQNVTTAITLDVQNFVAARALGITAPAPVNLHHALPAVADALQAPVLASTVHSLAGLPTADFKRVDPLSTGVELPPVGIASKGIIAIVAGSTAADQLGRVAAERHRRSIVQAVPTQQDLEERWLTQDTFYGLVAMRYASRMTSWPKPVTRFLDQLPDDVVGPSGDATAPIGVTAAVEASTATGWINRRQNDEANRKASHLDIDFRVPFGADKAAADPIVLQDRVEPTVGGGTAGIDQLRPDGLRINGDFTWTSAPAGAPIGGPLRMVNVSAGASADRSLTGRHFGMWFKPHTDWSTSEKIYPVLECRSPAINLGAQLNGTAGSNELQNYIAVLYDRERQLLVTVIAPPIIEHTTDWGPLTLFDNFDPVTSALIDERCLGDASQEPSAYASAPSVLLPLAPKQPYPGAVDEWDEANAIYTTQVSKLYKPNRVVHCYKVADPNDPLGGGPVPFFRKDRWYRLDLVIAGDRPGDVLTIVDGIVGQDVSRTPPASADDMVTGDRLTLPAMPLVTALPLVTQPPAAGGADYVQPTIEVLPVLGLNAEDLYPSRGVIRIDDEYIAYESVSLNTFSNCQRAQRQNTQTDAADPNNWWPLTQEHLPGTMIVPGGYRLQLTQGTIYAGGSTLDANLGNGDAVAGPQQWLIWSRLDHTKTPVDTMSSNPASLMRYPLGSTTFPLAADGVPPQFPPRGIVEFQGRYLAYNGIIGNELQNIVDASTIPMAPAPAPAFPVWNSDIEFPIPGGGIEAPMVTLVGFPLTGDPLTPGAYDVTNGSGDAFMLQLAHPLSGRIEWVSYTNLAYEATLGGFAIHRSGWGLGTRGKQRTDFVGNVGTHLNPLHFFPAGSDVIPVQTELGGAAHWVMTGDVVSLVPREPEVNGAPIQAVVRYATVDGYDSTGGNAAPDTKNEYFAFGHTFPNALNAADYDLLVWPGWSATDLTPMNPVTAPRGAPFRLDLAAPGSVPSAGVDLAILTRDPNPLKAIAPAAAAALASARDASVGGATIDALVAGNLDYPDNDTARASGMGIVRAIDGTGEVITDIATIGAIVQFNLPAMFTRPYGLVNIAGETFAYRQLLTAEAATTRAALGGIPGAPSFSNNKALQDSHQFAVLIGRGLLDLTDPASVVVNLPTGPIRAGSLAQVRPLVPCIPLPLGPVAQLNADLTDYTLGTLDTGILAAGGSNPESIAHGGFDAPYALVCTPTGEADAATMVGFAGGVARRRSGANPPIWDTEYTTAPWLRGLYNTDPAGAGVAGDIVIGWWPRLPPAMPGATHPSTNDQAIYRCRRFAWIGFPMAMHGARFDLSANPATVTIDNSSSGVKTDDLFSIEARAASVADPDWTRPAINIVSGFGVLSGLDALFTGSADFAGADVSGAELRVCWRYAVAPTSHLDGIAEAGSRAPFITDASLRWRAPLAVLAVEEAR